MDEAARSMMRTASAAYRRFAGRADGADRDRPTRLAGWCVGDLLDHVAWGAAMEAAAVRAAIGRPATEAAWDLPLEDAVANFAEAAELEVASDAPIALPAGTVPLGYAAPLFAFEAALHDLDLAQALGADWVALTDEELMACATVVGPMLDLLAAAAPEGEVTIDLLGLGGGIRLRSADGGWQRTAPDPRVATTTVVGRPQDVVLFACGRVGADVLDVRGDRLHAEQFKAYFPGP